jgi:hypothetical protein
VTDRFDKRLTRRSTLGLGASAAALGTAAGAGLLPLPLWAQATGKKVALVIGNSAYPGNMALANPANDAKAMADVLRRMGFEVVELLDVGKTALDAGLARTRAALAGGKGVGVLFYAGHGLQLDWRNYMVPVDARLAAAADVQRQCMDISAVIDAFKAANNSTNVIILDACRDNPFAGSASSGKGLAPLDAPSNTVLAYATAPGNVAEDGTAASGNGLYTGHLLDEIVKPVRIEDVFKRVRLNVRKASQGRQIPWEVTSLEDDFAFNTTSAAIARPTGQSAIQAAFAIEKADWDRIKDSTNPADFFAFLQKYPSGQSSELAQFRLDQLQRPVIQAQAGKDGVQAIASGTRRHEKGDIWIVDFTDLMTNTTTRGQRTVVEATDLQAVFDGPNPIILDQLGNIIENFTGRKDPALVQYPAELRVGKRWRTVFDNAVPGRPVERGTYFDYRVVRQENLKLPRGERSAFRIEGEGFTQSGVQLSASLWADARTGLSLGGENSARDRRGLLRSGRAVMVDYLRNGKSLLWA